MAKRRKKTKQKKRNFQKRRPKSKIKSMFLSALKFFRKQIVVIPGVLKRYILSSIMFLLFLISLLSFFGLSGKIGRFLHNFLFAWIEHAFYLVPFVFFLWAVIFLVIARRLIYVALAAGLIFLISAGGIFSLSDSIPFSGGKVGEIFSSALKELFGNVVSHAIFAILIFLSSFAFYYLFALYFRTKKEEKKSPTFEKGGGKETMLGQMLKKFRAFPKFKVSKVERPAADIDAGVLQSRSQEGIVPQGERQLRQREVKFTPPPLDFLEKDREKAHSGNIKENATIIKKTLENFGIGVAMAGVNVGPTVTQYTLKPDEAVRLSKITALNNNLALALAAHPIRIEAPIPGKSLVGIEVPNKIRSKVRLRDLLELTDFQKSGSKLSFPLGRDVAGTPLFNDLARLPHLLVAGSTGTGKTIFLNSLILSLLYKNNPSSLKFVLVDPKRVEFVVYQGLPHLVCPVILDAQGAINALKWLVEEMERRFVVLSDAKVKDISSYNGNNSNPAEFLPYIVLIIDELADLMAARGKEIEASIVRIAQMARAVGIHLVVATQRPSVEVITGLIKANITSRVSFQVATQFDSRTVLDMAGSEKLLGLGDMLHISAETIKPRRIQGAYVSEKEVKRVVQWIIKNIVPEGVKEDILFKSMEKFQKQEIEGAPGKRNFDDPLYNDAKEIVIRAGRASASLLQRRLQVGYARAARLLDMLEAKAVIGPHRGAKPREVYSAPETDEFYAP